MFMHKILQLIQKYPMRKQAALCIGLLAFLTLEGVAARNASCVELIHEKDNNNKPESDIDWQCALFNSRNRIAYWNDQIEQHCSIAGQRYPEFHLNCPSYPDVACEDESASSVMVDSFNCSFTYCSNGSYQDRNILQTISREYFTTQRVISRLLERFLDCKGRACRDSTTPQSPSITATTATAGTAPEILEPTQNGVIEYPTTASYLSTMSGSTKELTTMSDECMIEAAGRCYWIFLQRSFSIDFFRAQRICANRGLELAAIPDEETYRAVVNHIRRKSSRAVVWLGMTINEQTKQVHPIGSFQGQWLGNIPIWDSAPEPNIYLEVNSLYTGMMYIRPGIPINGAVCWGPKNIGTTRELAETDVTTPSAVTPFRNDDIGRVTITSRVATTSWITTPSESCISTNIDNKTSGYIQSPNYPGFYHNNACYSWKIIVPEGMVIMVESQGNFRLEGVEGVCAYDSLSFDGYARFCGSSFRGFQTRNNMLKVNFTSDGSVTERGFSILWYAVRVPTQSTVQSHRSGNTEHATMANDVSTMSAPTNEFTTPTGIVPVLHYGPIFDDCKYDANGGCFWVELNGTSVTIAAGEAACRKYGSVLGVIPDDDTYFRIIEHARQNFSYLSFWVGMKFRTDIYPARSYHGHLRSSTSDLLLTISSASAWRDLTFTGLQPATYPGTTASGSLCWKPATNNTGVNHAPTTIQTPDAEELPKTNYGPLCGNADDSVRNSSTDGCYWIELRRDANVNLTEARAICSQHESVLSAVPDYSIYQEIDDQISYRYSEIWVDVRLIHTVLPEGSFDKSWYSAGGPYYKHAYLSPYGFRRGKPDRETNGALCWKPRRSSENMTYSANSTREPYRSGNTEHATMPTDVSTMTVSTIEFTTATETCNSTNIDNKTSGYVNSPNYPGFYHNKACYLWNITVPEGMVIVVESQGNFILEGNCAFDSLSFAGYATFCGSSFRDFRTRDNMLKVKFTSDASVRQPGFSLLWYAVRVPTQSTVQSHRSGNTEHPTMANDVSTMSASTREFAIPTDIVPALHYGPIFDDCKYDADGGCFWVELNGTRVTNATAEAACRKYGSVLGVIPDEDTYFKIIEHVGQNVSYLTLWVGMELRTEVYPTLSYHGHLRSSTSDILLTISSASTWGDLTFTGLQPAMYAGITASGSLCWKPATNNTGVKHVPTTILSHDAEELPKTNDGPLSANADDCMGNGSNGGCYWIELRRDANVNLTEARAICSQHESELSAIPDENIYQEIQDRIAYLNSEIWLDVRLIHTVLPEGSFDKSWFSAFGPKDYNHAYVATYGFGRGKPDYETNGALCWKPRRQSENMTYSAQSTMEPFRSGGTEQATTTVSHIGKRTDTGSESTAPMLCPTLEQKLDIIFILDGSYSVRDYFDDIIRWTQNMTARFGVNSGLNQIGVVLYSNYERGKTLRNQKYITTEIRLGQFKRNLELNNSIRNIRRNGVSTYTAHALNKTVLDFRAGPRWSDPDTMKVMVVLTDGDASDGDQLECSANYVRSLGIIPFAVGVGDYDITELRTIATGDQTSDQRVLRAEDFDRLDGTVQELSTAIEKVVLEETIPALHRGPIFDDCKYNACGGCFWVALHNSSGRQATADDATCRQHGSVLGVIPDEETYFGIIDYVKQNYSELSIWLGMEIIREVHPGHPIQKSWLSGSYRGSISSDLLLTISSGESQVDTNLTGLRPSIVGPSFASGSLCWKPSVTHTSEKPVKAALPETDELPRIKYGPLSDECKNSSTGGCYWIELTSDFPHDAYVNLTEAHALCARHDSVLSAIPDDKTYREIQDRIRLHSLAIWVDMTMKPVVLPEGSFHKYWYADLGPERPVDYVFVTPHRLSGYDASFVTNGAFCWKPRTPSEDLTHECISNQSIGCYWIELHRPHSINFTHANTICRRHNSSLAMVYDKNIYDALTEELGSMMSLVEVWSGMTFDTETGQVNPLGAFDQYRNTTSYIKSSKKTRILLTAEQHVDSEDSIKISGGSKNVESSYRADGVLCWTPRD